jgi:cytochrome c oxidase cbb3-type subunit 3
MSVGERDPHTGHMTTGHEWGGIKELNTPVPKPVIWFLIGTFIFSLIYWVLMPAWPLGVTYTRGLLGLDQRDEVMVRVAEGQAARADWVKAIEEGSFDSIQDDEVLMDVVRGTGSSLFGDNCAVCHGLNGQGGPGFPSLAAGSWLWGGEPEDVWETIRVGINSDHPETRMSEMLAFGRDQILDRSTILDVVAYLQSLPGSDDPQTPLDPEAVARGEETFAMQCTACHGENGQGDPAMGAPDLTDDVWIYGGDRDSLYWSIYRGRKGHMPHWEERLSPVERKILTLYVLEIAKGRD